MTIGFVIFGIQLLFFIYTVCVSTIGDMSHFNSHYSPRASMINIVFSAGVELSVKMNCSNLLSRWSIFFPSFILNIFPHFLLQ